MAFPAALGIPSILGLIGRGATAAYPFLRGALGFTGRRTAGGNLQNIAAASLLTGTGAYYGINKFGDSKRKATAAATQSGYPRHASGALPTEEFNKGMEKSVAEASKNGEDDPFNFNQLFLASILQGLKQKPPASASGKVAGSYIPKPELPKMSDYDSNKTYWNIG